MYAHAKAWIRQSRSLVNQLVLSRTYFSLFWGYAGVLCLNILAYPLLTRWYGPQAFGELAVFSNTVLILSSIGALGLEKAIVVAKSRLRAVNLAFLSVGLLAVFSIFSGIILFLLPVRSMLEIPAALHSYWFVLPAVVFVAGSCQIAYAGLLRKAAFQELSLIRFLLRAATLATQTGLVLLAGVQYGLIAGFVAGFVLVFLLLFVRYFHFGYSFRLSLAFSKQSWQRFSDFPRYSFPQNVLHHVSAKIPFLIAGMFFGMQEVGYFSVAYGLLSLPEALVAAAVGDMFFQKISSSDNYLRIKSLLRHYWMALLLIGIVPFGFLIVYGQEMLVFFLGETWRTTGQMIGLMAPMFLFTFISTPTSTTLTVIRKQQWALYFGILSFVMRPLIFYVAYLWADILFGLTLWVVFEIIQLTLFNFLVYRLVKQHASVD